MTMRTLNHYVKKFSYVLGSELWECKFDGLLGLIKEYIVDVWEIRKHKLYDTLHLGRGVVSSVRMVSLV